MIPAFFRGNQAAPQIATAEPDAELIDPYDEALRCDAFVH